ncbi:MAG: hypothetical protein M5T61_10090 [Acidimicrobiia bacterium]|nr:hypothetical protein [Acidimicrobiia bacterium]
MSTRSGGAVEGLAGVANLLPRWCGAAFGICELHSSFQGPPLFVELGELTDEVVDRGVELGDAGLAGSFTGGGADVAGGFGCRGAGDGPVGKGAVFGDRQNRGGGVGERDGAQHVGHTVGGDAGGDGRFGVDPQDISEARSVRWLGGAGGCVADGRCLVNGGHEQVEDAGGVERRFESGEVNVGIHDVDDSP